MLKRKDGTISFAIDDVTNKLHKVTHIDGKFVDLGDISDKELKKLSLKSKKRMDK